MSELSRIPRNLNYAVLPIEDYEIASWCPAPDGKEPATMVVIELRIKGNEMPLLLRLKSRRAAQEMLDGLTFHMNDVWPEGERR